MLAGLVALAATGTAWADSDGAKIDWTSGTVTARGVGVANRHAPSPAAARGPARRLAEDAARKRLAAGVATVPLAGGGTLADKLGDAAVKARVDKAVANAIVSDATPETDGSWTVTMGVPLEALRQALAGPRKLVDRASDEGPPIVVVENVAAAPGLGWTVDKLAAPTLWVKDAKDVPAWAKGAPRVKATSATAGAIVTPGTKATASTLFVLVR
jgi:hypothetical protein